MRLFERLELRPLGVSAGDEQRLLALKRLGDRGVVLAALQFGRDHDRRGPGQLGLQARLTRQKAIALEPQHLQIASRRQVGVAVLRAEKPAADADRFEHRHPGAKRVFPRLIDKAEDVKWAKFIDFDRGGWADRQGKAALQIAGDRRRQFLGRFARGFYRPKQRQRDISARPDLYLGVERRPFMHFADLAAPFQHPDVNFVADIKAITRIGGRLVGDCRPGEQDHGDDQSGQKSCHRSG